MSASPAPTLIPNPVAMWHGAIEAISPHAPPCRYLTAARWAPIREAALDFCTRLGADAHALGWTERELFAVHPEHGTLRIDYCGALMISGDQVRAVEPNRLVFESGSAYRTQQGQIWGVPVWEFAKKAAGR